jgi:hypothetical protein
VGVSTSATGAAGGAGGDGFEEGTVSATGLSADSLGGGAAGGALAATRVVETDAVGVAGGGVGVDVVSAEDVVVTEAVFVVVAVAVFADDGFSFDFFPCPLLDAACAGPLPRAEPRRANESINTIDRGTGFWLGVVMSLGRLRHGLGGFRWR